MSSLGVTLSLGESSCGPCQDSFLQQHKYASSFSSGRSKRCKTDNVIVQQAGMGMSEYNNNLKQPYIAMQFTLVTYSYYIEINNFLIDLESPGGSIRQKQ